MLYLLIPPTPPPLVTGDPLLSPWFGLFQDVAELESYSMWFFIVCLFLKKFSFKYKFAFLLPALSEAVSLLRPMQSYIFWVGEENCFYLKCVLLWSGDIG